MCCFGLFWGPWTPQLCPFGALPDEISTCGFRHNTEEGLKFYKMSKSRNPFSKKNPAVPLPLIKLKFTLCNNPPVASVCIDLIFHVFHSGSFIFPLGLVNNQLVVNLVVNYVGVESLKSFPYDIKIAFAESHCAFKYFVSRIVHDC